MKRQALMAVLVAAATGGLAACDEAAPSPQQSVASPAPSSQPATVPALFQPPSVPATPGDTSAAAKALAAAGERTTQAGSLRMKLVAHVGAPQATRTLDVTSNGESESPSRSHVLVVVNLSSRTVTTESMAYDGAFYSRGEGEPWRRVTGAAASGGDPRHYANFASASRSVLDVGDGTRAGMPAEEYTAVAEPGGGGDQAVGIAPASTPASPIRVTAWVDLVHGRLVGLDLVFPDVGAGPGSMSIDFSDFGAAIKLAPPTPAP
jgi:hypothetical protein